MPVVWLDFRVCFSFACWFVLELVINFVNFIRTFDFGSGAVGGG